MEEKTTKLGICCLCGSSCLIDAVVEDNKILQVQKAPATPM